MARKHSKPRLLKDLRRLSRELIAPYARANRLLDTFQRDISPTLPEIHVVFQPHLGDEVSTFLSLPGNRCGHAHGGDEPAEEEPECLWCAMKEEADKVDFVRKWNAQVTFFNSQLNALEAERIDRSMDTERGWTHQLSMAYDAKKAILSRAAQAWMLAHPPPPEYAGVMADQGYPGFCPSRLVHVECKDPDCLDCHGLVWLAYVDELLNYFSQGAAIEGRVQALDPFGGQSFWSNPEGDAQSPRFRFNAIRKRAAMNEYLRWNEATPLPDKEATARRLRRGPGNHEQEFHPWCRFHNCVDEYCTGMH